MCAPLKLILKAYLVVPRANEKVLIDSQSPVQVYLDIDWIGLRTLVGNEQDKIPMWCLDYRGFAKVMATP